MFAKSVRIFLAVVLITLLSALSGLAIVGVAHNGTSAAQTAVLIPLIYKSVTRLKMVSTAILLLTSPQINPRAPEPPLCRIIK